MKRIPKIILIIPVILMLVIALFRIVPYMIALQTEESPIKSIQATNDYIYEQGKTIYAKDFTVVAMHENGKESTLSSSEYTISTDTPAITGDTTIVEIVMTENEKIKCKVEVQNKRDAVVRYKVGNPNLEDVTATLYSNGELCFSGSGDVLQFRDFPWIAYDEEDYPIVTITFEEGVAPTIMDEWFAGIDTLEYVATIPKSVQSMNGTFSGCSALKEGADWSHCANLNNIESVYSGCTSLTYVPAVPKSVVVASNMCYGCSELKEAADLTGAESLKEADGMFQNCIKLVKASIAPNLSTMTYMYGDCINLKEMPTIPKNVLDISNAFSGCKSLQTATNIPSSVAVMDGVFRNCANLTGSLTIDSNADSYSSLFDGACIATRLSISGSSENLENIITITNNPNITIGKSKEKSDTK